MFVWAKWCPIHIMLLFWGGGCRLVSYASNVASFSVLPILMYPVLPVSLYCPFLCIQCCQFLCITHSYVSNVASFSVLSILVVLCLMYPVLPVSLYCPFLCIQCCQFLCIVHSYVSNVASFSVLSILMYPMLPVSLYCPFLCPSVFSNVSLYIKISNFQVKKCRMNTNGYCMTYIFFLFWNWLYVFGIFQGFFPSFCVCLKYFLSCNWVIFCHNKWVEINCCFIMTVS